jgi:hypothetical protein
MCNNVIIHGPKTRTATCQGELADIIGRKNMVMDSLPDALHEDAEFCATDCLCPVNLSATAAKAGYQHSRIDAEGEHDPFDVHWRRTG